MVDPDNRDPNPDTNSNSNGTRGDVVELASQTDYEQQHILEDEEAGWSSQVWKDAAQAKQGKDSDGEEVDKTKEWVWTNEMVLDPRIADRMRTFELEEGARERAEVAAEEKRLKQPRVVDRLRGWVGWAPRERRGWEMGEVGGEDD